MKALVAAVAITGILSGQAVLAQNKTVRPGTVLYMEKPNLLAAQREALDRVVLDYRITV